MTISNNIGLFCVFRVFSLLRACQSWSNNWSLLIVLMFYCCFSLCYYFPLCKLFVWFCLLCYALAWVLCFPEFFIFVISYGLVILIYHSFYPNDGHWPPLFFSCKKYYSEYFCVYETFPLWDFLGMNGS